MELNTNTKWFEDRELPNINSPEDLLNAFSIVKNQFNGSPKYYTRNDYILLINTIYAALTKKWNQGQDSAVLSKDITSNYYPEVGYVKDATTLFKGTSLTDALEQILVGTPDTPIKLQDPTIHGDKNPWYDSDGDNLITITNPNQDSLIFYTVDTDHGARIYTDPFYISQTTTVKAWCVPTIYTHKYEKSDICIESFNKIYPTSLQLPTVTSNSDYSQITISLQDNNININPNNYKIQYKLNPTDSWTDYIGADILSNTTYFEVQCIALSQNYISTGSKIYTFKFKTLDSPIIKLTNFEYNPSQVESNNTSQGGTYSFYGELYYMGIQNSSEYQSIICECDGSSIKEGTSITTAKIITVTGVASDGITTATTTVNLKRNYLTPDQVVINANSNFNENQTISISVKNNHYYTVYYQIDNDIWQEYTGPFDIDKTCTIYAKTDAVSKMNLMFGKQESLSTDAKHVTKNIIANAFVNLDDPIGMTYEDYDEEGDLITITVVEKEKLNVATLTKCNVPSLKLREVKETCYGLMYPDSESFNFKVYSVNSDKIEGISNIQILSDDTNWPLLTMSSSDIKNCFAPNKTTITINGITYYEFILHDFEGAGINITTSAIIKFIK